MSTLTKVQNLINSVSTTTKKIYLHLMIDIPTEQYLYQCTKMIRIDEQSNKSRDLDIVAILFTIEYRNLK